MHVNSIPFFCFYFFYLFRFLEIQEIDYGLYKLEYDELGYVNLVTSQYWEKGRLKMNVFC